MTLTIRATSALERPFLERMLAVAADWQPGREVRSVDEVLAVPELARYLAGWPRKGVQTTSTYNPARAAVRAISDSWAGGVPQTSSLLVMAAYAVVAGSLAVLLFRWD